MEKEGDRVGSGQQAGSARAGGLGPRLTCLLLGAVCLMTGLDAALVRLGTWAPVTGARLATLHGPLMLVGFMGTVIALERAVAARTAWAFVAPAAQALGCLALLAGAPQVLGKALATAGALVLVAVYVRVHRRAPGVAVDVEAMGALALLLGDIQWLGGDVPAAVGSWLLLPTLTIVGERLELARVAFIDQAVERTVRALAVAALLGTCLLPVAPAAHVLVGAALLGLAVVMTWYDVARRTIRATGAIRFAAASMLAGYLWLAVAGATWTLTPLEGSAYEIVIHALALGYGFSMILAHAPTIVPAIVHRRLPYHRLMWVPYALLHGGLAVRVVALAVQAVGAWRAGGVAGVLAVLVFLAVSLTRAVASGSIRRGAPGRAGPALRRPGRRSTQVRRNAVVLAWVVAAAILAVLVIGGPLAAWGQWLPLHTLLLGAIGSAITVWSAHFADTLLHRPALGGAALLDARLYAHGVGTACVLAGITASWPVLALAGAAVVAAAALAGALAVAVQYRRAVAPRLGALAVHYAVALVLLACGAALGYLTSWTALSGRAGASDILYVAHTMTMVLGFVGTTVLGTLTVLWPTMLRTKMEAQAPRWAARGLPALVAGTAVLACSGLWPPLGVLGAAVYLGGAASVLVPAARTARRVRPVSFATMSAAAAVAWFLGCVTWIGLGVSTDYGAGVLAPAPASGGAGAARELIHAVRVPLATGFALQVLAAALTYLTPVMLGGGPATTRATNAIMDRWAAWRTVSTNACLLLAAATPLPWAVRLTGALVAGAVGSYVLVAMALSAGELVRRARSTGEAPTATPPARPPGSGPSDAPRPAARALPAAGPQSKEEPHD